jgi:predicted ester cyclase
MSVEANKATVRRVADEIFSQGKLEVIDDIFAPHYVGHTQHGTVVHGPAGVKQFVAQYLAAFSQAQSVVEDQVAEGDRVVVRLTFTGTHTGPWREQGDAGGNLKTPIR